MTVIFKNDCDGEVLRYEATHNEWEFLMMLSREEILNENWNFFDLDGIEEIRKREED